MVVQKTLDDIRGRPHEEKKVVAGGIAIGLVVILMIGWGFLFLRKIQRGAIPTLEGSAVPADQFDAAFLRRTQDEIRGLYNDSASQLRELRDNAARSEVQGSGSKAESVPTDTSDYFSGE